MFAFFFFVCLPNLNLDINSSIRLVSACSRSHTRVILFNSHMSPNEVGTTCFIDEETEVQRR